MCTERARSQLMGRSTAREPLLSGNGSGRPAESSALCISSVDRAVDRPTVKFITIEPTGRPLSRPSLDPESNGSLAGRSLGRPELDTESRALCRSTGRSTRAFSREQKLSGSRPTRSTGPPAWLGVCLCTSVDRIGRPTSAPVDRPGQPADSQSSQYRI